MPHPEVVVSTTRPFAVVAAERIVHAMEEVTALRGRCSIALAGGTTPRGAYEEMAGERLSPRVPWAALDVYFGDERCVAPDDPASNYLLARQTLLSGSPPARVHRLRAEDPASGAEEYERILPSRLDVLLLGIGEDGHVASLFPGSPALAEHERRIAVVTAPKPPPRRITITPRVITEAHWIVVLAAGAAKAEAVRRTLEGPFQPSAVPAQLALHATWVLDVAAAAGLARPSRSAS